MKRPAFEDAADRELGELLEQSMIVADPIQRQLLIELTFRRSVALNAPRAVIALIDRLRRTHFAELPAAGHA